MAAFLAAILSFIWTLFVCCATLGLLAFALSSPLIMFMFLCYVWRKDEGTSTAPPNKDIWGAQGELPPRSPNKNIWG